jgi:hypothetical protein
LIGERQPIKVNQFTNIEVGGGAGDNQAAIFDMKRFNENPY